MDINYLDLLNPEIYPDIKDLIVSLQKWNRKADINSIGAGIFAVLYDQLRPYYQILPDSKIFPPTILIKALEDTKAYLLKHFDSTQIQLGTYQKLVRGLKEIPIFGSPDVITAMAAKPYKDGKVKVVSGESYIQLIRFSKIGTEIESVISYGSSDDPKSPHYDDQMEMYSQFQTKKMSLDKNKVYKDAERIYHPK